MGLGSVVGGIAGAAGSVIGGLLGNSASAASNANAQAINEFNYKAQKEFAQNGIRWKVADAKAAGLHPLAALGASGASYSPSAAIGTSPDYGWMGDAASSLGQGIGRAVEAKMTAKERAHQRMVADQATALSMETKRLQNQFLETQIAAQKQDMALQLARSAAMAVRTQQAPPSMPSVFGTEGTVIAGQAEAYPTGRTAVEVSKVPTTVRGDSTTQAGTPPDTRVYSTTAGRSVLPNEAIGDVIESLPGAGLQWMFRNQIIPYIGNFTNLVRDPRRRPGEYFDLLSGTYRRGRRIRDYFPW